MLRKALLKLGSSSEEELLWGLLHIKIVRCENLRNADDAFKLNTFRKNRDLSDPYVTAFLGDYTYRLLKTRVVDNDLNPVFDEEFYCQVGHLTDGIRFNVKDQDSLKDKTLGKYFLPVKELIKTVDAADEDEGIEEGDLKRVGIHKVVYLDGKKSHGTLEFFVEFLPVRMLVHNLAVPGIYFPPTQGNSMVRYYMNADDDGSTPQIQYGNEEELTYEPPRLWRDMYDAICQAKHFVYVVGWSVDVDQYLLRGQELEEALEQNEYSPRIGELLKQKAEEGVVVNVMQWDDATSNFMNFAGMLCTSDEKTRHFFMNSKVNVALVQTVGDDTNSIVEGKNKQVAFTHHQKFVALDAPPVDGDDGDTRELLGFLGGIDLTGGRWDNQKHPLFRSLQGDHKDDVYSCCFQFHDVAASGPREPWHDIHSAVRGPIVHHLVQSFEERWLKQAPKLVGELINIHHLDLVPESEDTGWNFQMSRSIDARINTFDRAVEQSFRNVDVDKMNCCDWELFTEDKDVEMSRYFESSTDSDITYNRCLNHKKGRLVDKSIHTSYVHHIRRAKHFIYIETQYFMGSSFMWSDKGDRKVKCNNLIPSELTLKICEKIAAGERFAVYILLPMWPEAISDTGSCQEILFWQRSTIESMYDKIQAALDHRMSNSSDHGLQVSDYLNFYCLGNRETPEGSQATKPPHTSDEKTLTATRRHQVYIHSKMMIVDDEVVLIGSANINQRSLDGCRDSEILLTSWHSDHLATKDETPKGDIHAFRMHIWSSITNRYDDLYKCPSSTDCINAMNGVASVNWQAFVGDEVVDMESHLLPSPFEYYAEDGKEKKLEARRGLKKGRFPDTDGSVLGKKSFMLPDMLTT